MTAGEANALGLRLVAALALLTVALVRQAPVHAAGVTCPPAPAGSYIHGSVRVTGACTLTGVTVTGSITVTGNGNLDLENSTVDGNLFETNAVTMLVSSDVIDGRTTIAGSAQRPQLCGSTFVGVVAVTRTDDAHPVRIGEPDDSCPGDTLRSNVIVSHSAPVEIEYSQIDGSLSVSYSSAGLGYDTIAGNALCSHVTPFLDDDEGSLTVGGRDTCSNLYTSTSGVREQGDRLPGS